MDRSIVGARFTCSVRKERRAAQISSREHIMQNALCFVESEVQNWLGTMVVTIGLFCLRMRMH
jgi:hypothetical protein